MYLCTIHVLPPPSPPLPLPPLCEHLLSFIIITDVFKAVLWDWTHQVSGLKHGLWSYPVTFLPAHSINIKQLRHPPSVWRTNVSHGVLVFTILSATYKQSTFMYILYNQLPLHVCALWKKNKYSFFLSFCRRFLN
jgi:hypothetical protein